MNNKINRLSKLEIIKNYISKYMNFFASAIGSVIIIFIIFQLYLYNKSSTVLKNSLLYHEIISNKSLQNYQEEIEKLSNDKGFYGVLAILEKIKIKLNNEDLESAYDDYISLLKEKKFSNLYKSIIAIQGSYILLNKINILELKKSHALFSSTGIYKKITNFLSYIDNTIISLEGYKLELNYLLLIIEQEYNGDKIIYDNAKKFYDQIQQSANISSSIKERVKKIHEFQKYN